MSKLKKLVSKQYQSTVDQASSRWSDSSVPPEGWLRTVRKALSMTLLQVGERLGTSSVSAAQFEKAELNGGVTLKAMRRTAEAMGCEFVYAVVPRKPVLEILRDQANKQARLEMAQANEQMALEDQALTEDQIAVEVQRLVLEKLANLSPRLWDKK